MGLNLLAGACIYWNQDITQLSYFLIFDYLYIVFYIEHIYFVWSFFIRVSYNNFENQLRDV